MNRRGFLGMLSMAVLTPLAKLVPERRPEKRVMALNMPSKGLDNGAMVQMVAYEGDWLIVSGDDIRPVHYNCRCIVQGEEDFHG